MLLRKIFSLSTFKIADDLNYVLVFGWLNSPRHRMAKQRSARNGERSVFVNFDHHLRNEEISAIFKEGVKHLLFHRHQLPLPFLLIQKEDQLKQEEPLGHSHRSLRKPRWIRKKDAAVEAVCRLLDGLENIASTSRIHKIALLFGSTIVTPRETFIIHPTFTVTGKTNQQGEELKNGMLQKSVNKSCRLFLRTLVTNELLQGMKSLPPTSTHILVLAPRNIQNSPTDVFFPNMTYRVSHNRGEVCHLFLTNQPMESISRDKFYSEIESESSEELIWYQFRQTIKGYTVKE